MYTRSINIYVRETELHYFQWNTINGLMTNECIVFWEREIERGHPDVYIKLYNILCTVNTQNTSKN